MTQASPRRDDATDHRRQPHRHLDSTVPVGGGQAVYVEALAEQVPAADLEPAIETCSLRSKSHGAGPWRVADVVGSASHRLYRAEASAHYVLVRNDARIPVGANAT